MTASGHRPLLVNTGNVSTVSLSSITPACRVLELIRRERLLAILRLQDPEFAVDLAGALIAGGMRVLELTLGHERTPSVLARLVGSVGPSVLVGAGTVTTVEQVRQAADSGVSFIVAPNFDVEVVTAALEAGLVPVPGVATATEVLRARRAGAELVKLFPAGALGLPYLAALRGPLPDVPFLVTGGIARDAAGQWLAAGATAVGLGGDLVPGGQQADLAAVTAAAREAVAAISEGGS